MKAEIKNKNWNSLSDYTKIWVKVQYDMIVKRLKELEKETPYPPHKYGIDGEKNMLCELFGEDNIASFKIDNPEYAEMFFKSKSTEEVKTDEAMKVTEEKEVKQYKYKVGDIVSSTSLRDDHTLMVGVIVNVMCDDVAYVNFGNTVGTYMMNEKDFNVCEVLDYLYTPSIKKGNTVKVMSGKFSGTVGVVTEVDDIRLKIVVDNHTLGWVFKSDVERQYYQQYQKGDFVVDTRNGYCGEVTFFNDRLGLYVVDGEHIISSENLSRYADDDEYDGYNAHNYSNDFDDTVEEDVVNISQDELFQMKYNLAKELAVAMIGNPNGYGNIARESVTTANEMMKLLKEL